MSIKDKVAALAIGMMFAGMALASLMWGIALIYMQILEVSFVP